MRQRTLKFLRRSIRKIHTDLPEVVYTTKVHPNGSKQRLLDNCQRKKYKEAKRLLRYL